MPPARALVVPLSLALALLCVAPSCARESCPETASPEAAADRAAPAPETRETSAAVDALAAAGLPALIASEPAADAPPEVQAQFGRLVGAWSCQGEARQPDGTFKEAPGRARWTFFYTLGGQAIGDVFEPAVGAVGINLRVYDPDKGAWTLAWTTPTLRRYDHFEARQEGETIVMRGDIAAKGPFPDHRAKITFSAMTADAFEWRYEAATPGTDGPWQVFSRIHCAAAPTS